jgi:hypothetical protein
MSRSVNPVYGDANPLQDHDQTQDDPDSPGLDESLISEKPQHASEYDPDCQMQESQRRSLHWLLLVGLRGPDCILNSDRIRAHGHLASRRFLPIDAAV